MPETSRFVNPYTFVRIPDAVPRRRPPGHDGLNNLTHMPKETLHSGALTVRWTLETPLLLPAGAVDRDPDGTVVIPGSSIKGAVRSLHETMFRGCLRVVDEDFVPSYRSVAKSKSETEWRLGVVTRSSAAGEPLEIQLCDRGVVWVDAPSLARAYRAAGQGDPRTGDTLTIDGDVEETSLRDEMSHVETVTVDPRPNPEFTGQTLQYVLKAELPTGRRTLLVTDVRARHRRTRQRPPQRGRCLWATAVIGTETVTVSERVARHFAQACEGAEDRRRLLSPSAAAVNRKAPELVRMDATATTDWRSETQYSPISWWRTYGGSANGRDDMVVGQRALISGLLFPGDVVWVRPNGLQAAAIEHSVIWRELGHGVLADRVPKEALPCSDPGFDGPTAPRQGLCPSCEVFGSVDAHGDDRGGQQRAYGGHVRFGTARAVGNPSIQRIDLAPLGSPRLGAGMFSLRDTGRLGRRERYSRPGLWADGDGDGGLRPLRGRKFYWNSDPVEQQREWQAQLDRPITPRHVRRDGQRDFGGQRDTVEAGAVFEQTIWVDSISSAGLQSLLAALQPARVLGAARGTFTVRLGGGKPLGLGTASVEVVSSTVTGAADRYRGDRSEPTVHEPPGPDRDLLAGWLDRTACAGLTRILDTEGLGAERFLVSYPPGETWEHVNSPTFDESYRFFTNNTGQQLRDSAKPWAPLPELPDDGSAPFTASQPIFPPAPRQGR